MEQIAKVTRLINPHVAEIAVQRKSACGHDCSKCGGGCSEMLVQTEVKAAASNYVGAVPGDLVRVESESSQILGIAAVVYMVPLLLFFVLYFIGQYLAHTDSIAVALGVLGFAMGVALAVFVNGVVKRRRLTSFRITDVLKP